MILRIGALEAQQRINRTSYMNRMERNTIWKMTATQCAHPGLRSAWTTLVPKPHAAKREGGLEGLKKDLLNRALAQNCSPALVAPLRRAAEEAASLAWLEPHPLLVFPGLFAEKIRAARLHHQRQSRILSLSAVFLDNTP